MKYLLIGFYCCLVCPIFAQIGGRTNFEFLNLPFAAKQAALGTANVSSADQDATMWISNPAFLTDSTQNLLGLNFTAYFQNIKQLGFAYNQKLGKGNIGFGIHSLQYGTFDEYDNTGQLIGTFKANDVALILGYAQKQNAFSFGGNAKLVQSQLANYQLSGLLFDFGGLFSHPKKDWTIGLNLKNLGFGFGKTFDNQDFVMPLDILIGTSVRLAKTPFKFSITAQKLHQFLGLVKQNPNQAQQTDLFGNPINQKITFGEKLTRHFVVGFEFLPHKNLSFRFGYNAMTRSEMRTENRSGMVGMSFGIRLKIKTLDFQYALRNQSIGVSSNTLTMIVNMKNILRKKTTIP